MTVTELRIGNYLQVGAKPDRVIAIYQRIVVTTKFRIYHKDLEPVPITADILERCGFKELWIGRFSHPEGIGIEKYNDSGFHLLCEERTNWAARFKYVHEIQNLFFILCRKELNVEL